MDRGRLQVEVEVKDIQLQQKDDQIQRQSIELQEKAAQLERQQRELQTLTVKGNAYFYFKEKYIMVPYTLIVRRTKVSCRQRWRLRMLKLSGSRES